MELINTHCHSKYCGHGQGEISEYVEQAKDAGISTLAFTEHYPLSKNFDPNGYLSVPQEDMPLYIQAVKDARQNNPDMEILLGIELDYLSGDEDRCITPDSFNDFDLVLGSVHFVDRWPFDDPAQRDVWKEEGAANRIWERYVDIWCEAASNKNIRIDVMSHPDLAKKFGYYPDFALDTFYSRMAEAARAGQRMIELNTSGAYYQCKEVFPSLELLKHFCKAEVPCTVGTDAHEPRYVARDIQKAYKLLADAGYKCVSVPSRKGARRELPIE